jgi:methylated-DNA-[protein]-cysteine S-methyltransferase
MNASDSLESLLAAAREAAPPATVAGVAERARAAGLLDVAVATEDTPVGRLVLARTPRGLVRVAYAPLETVEQELATRISPRVLESPAALDEERRQLDDYFAGRRRSFELDLDWQLARGFSGEVLHAIARIPFGGTASYRDVAGDAGNARAVRAAGTACAKNPLVVVVPCHRVVRSDGGIGGYAGGLDAKRTLLALEGAA